MAASPPVPSLKVTRRRLSRGLFASQLTRRSHTSASTMDPRNGVHHLSTSAAYLRAQQSSVIVIHASVRPQSEKVVRDVPSHLSSWLVHLRFVSCVDRGQEFETFVVIASSQDHYQKIRCKKYGGFPLELTLASM